MSIYNLIKKLDYLGISPKFTYRGQARYSTIPGGLISFVLAIFFIAHFLYSSQDIYLRLNPSLLQQRIPNSNATRLNLTPDNFPFFLAVQDPTNNQNFYMDETVFYYRAFMRIQIRSYDDNGLVELKYSKIPVNLEPCDINYHFPGLEKEFNTTTYNKAYCIGKNQNLSIYGLFQNINFELLVIDIFQCMNSTISNNVCKTQNEIDKRLKSAYITLGISEYLNQPYNFSSPLQRIKQEYFSTISNYGMKEINVFIKRIFYNTDIGYIFEENYTKEYVQIDNINELYTSSISEIGNRFLKIGVRMSINEDYYFRGYKRIQDIIASTGGLIKFFFLISIYGINYTTKNNLFIDLLFENFIDAETKPNILFTSNINNEFQNNEINTTNSYMKPGHNKINKYEIGICNYFKLFYCKRKSKQEHHMFILYSNIINIAQKYLDVNNYMLSLFELKNFKLVLFDDKQLNLFNYLTYHNNKRKQEITDNQIRDHLKFINTRNSLTDQRLLNLYNQESVKVIFNNYLV